MWLQLLHQHGVQHPSDVMSNHIIILKSRAETAQARSAAVVAWMRKLGLTEAEIVDIITQRPMVFNVPLETANAVSEWLQHELGWNGSMISNVLVRYPRLFGLSPFSNLSIKLAWFRSHSFSTVNISSALYSNPALFNNAIAHNECQIISLKAMGLSPEQVTKVFKRIPHLLMRDMEGNIIQAKIHFLTQVMHMQVEELAAFPAFLTYSLMKRIGPRWGFHSLHCKGQSFSLAYRLSLKDRQYAESLTSQSLDAQCKARCLTRLQLYEEFRSQWQQGEERRWNLGNKPEKSQIKDGNESWPERFQKPQLGD